VTSADPTPRPRRSRLTRSGDFDSVYRRGKSASGRYLVVYAFRREDGAGDGVARLGVSVSRKVGGAVERNRVKRVLREQFTQIAGEFPAETDFVAIARAGVFEYLEEQGGAVLGERLGELARKAVGAGAPSA
jgi:ribonuclease P protein component